MSAAKLGYTDALVASMCARVYKPFDLGVLVCRVFWNIAVSVGLALAARELDGFLSAFLWALVALRLLPYALTGLAQRIKDEHAARLALVAPIDREVLRSSTRLARDWRRVA